MKLLFALTALFSSSNAFVHNNVKSATAFTRRSTFELHARQPIMAGNWKMNPATEGDALDLATGLTKILGDETCAVDDSDDMCVEVVIFPPFPFLARTGDIAAEAGITLGAQSIFFEDKGAYTGAVAASMVQSIGVEYILCGHSERRTLFNDDDEAINNKVKKVLQSGMKPILCVGETKKEYDLDIKYEVCRMQLSNDLRGVTKEQMKDVVIAYEPVWAIGTGLVCGAEEANAVHVYLRSVLRDMFDDEVAEQTRIQYGGSVTPDSVDNLMAQPDIDGCLVGGASLDADKFGRIINYVKA